MRAAIRGKAIETGRFARRLAQWFDNAAAAETLPAGASRRIDWIRILPFVGIHLACFGVLWVGASPIAVEVAVVMYLVRMFAITAFYHRYFSHRAFRASRQVQFAFACLAASAAQRGPLWWVSHHRHHHAHADMPSDAHSARQHGFLWSHAGWFVSSENFRTRLGLVRDFVQFPELELLDRFDALAPALLAIGLYAIGAILGHAAPQLGTSGPQLLVWGFFISTTLLYHATFTINSLAHRVGSRRYATRDDSRNNAWLALITLGEGWHNNHHHYPGAARQGFYWWEIDGTFYVLRLLAAFGVVHDLKAVPARVREARRCR